MAKLFQQWFILCILVLTTCTIIFSCAKRMIEIEHLKEEFILSEAWRGYKKFFIEENGRVFRPLNNFDTVSEGQAYAMLLAVWMDDRNTFDRCYQWAERNLSRINKFGDHLLAWHWKGEVLDWNPSSDADEDYAFALILAHRKWKDDKYKQKALVILNDILEKESDITPTGLRFLLPGTWPEPSENFIINPSYFSPAWYRVFYQVSGDNRWNELIDSSYYAISSLSESIGEIKGVGLLPNWAKIDKDGRFIKAENFEHHFGWDAVRVPWRIGLDLFWFREQRAENYLAKTLYNFYLNELSKNEGRIMAEYNYDGSPYGNYESPASYAMSLSSFLAAGSDRTELIMAKILESYIKKDDIGYFLDDRNYYVNSLVLLGLALKTGKAVE